ncbi:Mitogen-activated protein kinase kinase kinase A [Diplonema papillatum]|nr:Mitogen-activated protein kinase kinase kinase A [Diplonema papillatum]
MIRGSPTALCVWALLLLGLVGSACGWSDDDVITVLCPHPDDSGILEAAARNFSATHNVTVDVIIVQWDELYSGALENITKKVGADAMIVGSTWVPYFFSQGILSSLSDNFESWRTRRGYMGSIETDMFRSVEETYMFPGPESGVLEWFALPFNVDGRVLFYRKDLYQKYAAKGNGPDTIQEAIDIGRQVADGATADNATGYPMYSFGLPGAGADASEAMQVLTTFIVGGGASFVGAKGACSFETDTFKSGLRSYTDLYFNGDNPIRNEATSEIAKQFAEGRLVQMVGAFWLQDNLFRVGESGTMTVDQVGIKAMPSGQAGPYTFLGGSAWSIPTWVPSEKKKLAWRFLELITEPKGEYLFDFLFRSKLVPAYESVVRKARQQTGDAVAIKQLRLFDTNGDQMLLEKEWMHSPGGQPFNNAVPANAAVWDGEWIDFAIGPLEVWLPSAANISGYTFVTSTTTGSRDPIVIEFHGYDDQTGSWVLLDNWNGADQYKPTFIPHARSTPAMTRPLSTPGHPGFTKFRLVPVELRGSPCPHVCEIVVDQLGYAVPLNYPQRGFYKIGRLENNKTVSTMLDRIYNNVSVDDATMLGCREYNAIMRDPATEGEPDDDTVTILLIVLVSALVLTVVGGLIYRYILVREVTHTHNVNRKLRSDIEVAEDLSRAVAMMDLESVEYLFTLQKPSKIQESFIGIVRILKEYRAYLPEAVLLDEEKEIDKMHHNPLVNPSAAGNSSPMSPTEIKSQSFRRVPIDVKRASEAQTDSSGGGNGLRALKERALEVGVRMRKGALLRLVINLDDTSLQWENFATSTAWLERTLSTMQAHEGMSLNLRPNAILASWNGHRFSARATAAACQCALALQTLLLPMKPWWSISLAAGKMAVGHVGTSTQRAPFVVGLPLRQVETMNTLCERIRVRTLATDSVVETAAGVVDARPVDVICVEPLEGQPPMVALWEIRTPGTRWHEAPNDLYNEAWVKLRHNKFREAETLVTELTKQYPKDYQLLRLSLVVSVSAHQATPNESSYYRRLLGWEDSEGLLNGALVEANKATIEALAACAETSAASAVRARASVPEAAPALISDNLRTELEKEKASRPDTTPVCPECRENLVLQFSDGNASPSSWKCTTCSSEDKGRHWACKRCSAAKCLACVPLMSHMHSKLVRSMKDRNNNQWYRSESVLGKGSYGTVWLAMDSTGGLVAMKTVRISDEAEKGDELTSLLSEVDLLSTLRNDYVVSYFSSTIVSGHIAIIMEYVPGGSLSTLLEQFGPSLPTSSVKRYLKDILRGLEFLHDNKIVHRDLKPGNVLLMIDGQCKLSDFGTSTSWSTQQVDATPTDSPTKKVAGTPIYMSPEACRGSCGKSVDIWALGITVYLMMTGRVPYSIKSFQVRKFLASLGRSEIIPDISRLEPGHGKAFVQDCLRMVPEDRPDAPKLMLHHFLL